MTDPKPFILLFLAHSLFASSECSPLLAQIIANTRDAATESSPAKSQTALWEFGTESLSIKVEDGNIELIGARYPVALKKTLTPAELKYFKDYTLKNAQRFGVKLSQDGNAMALKAAVNYATLHSALYSEQARPIDAAKQIEALIRRSSSQNPHLKVTIRMAATEVEQMESISKFADGLSEAAHLHKRGRLEPILKDIKDEAQQEAGRQLIDDLLGKKEPVPTVDDILDATNQRQKRENPKAVELTIDYAHDEPRKVHIERRQDGKLKITVTPGLMMRIDSLRKLIELLQGQGFSGKDYDWRTYEQIDSTPFLN